MTLPRRHITPENALMRAEALCARAEHSAGEITAKLRTWGVAPREAATIIESLEQRRFIDDCRFARAYVRDKVLFARWGRIKIRQALAVKRIATNIATEALTEAVDSDTYLQALQHVIAAKRRTLPEVESYESRMKLMRHAMSRGFEPELVRRVLNSSDIE